MNEKLRDRLTVLNAFVHDVATGTWLSSLKVFGWTGGVSRDRVRLLEVKHALLGVAFAAGTAWLAAIVYFG